MCSPKTTSAASWLPSTLSPTNVSLHLTTSTAVFVFSALTVKTGQEVEIISMASRGLSLHLLGRVNIEPGGCLKIRGRISHLHYRELFNIAKGGRLTLAGDIHVDDTP